MRDIDQTAATPNVALVLVVTTAVQALVTMIIVLPAALAPAFAAALDVPASFVGVQVSLVFGGAMVMSIASGTLVRRWGAIRASQAALMFAFSGGALMAMPWLPAVGAGALICGLGYALTNPPASHLLQRVTTPRDRNLLFSLKQTSVPLGGIGAGLIAPPMAVNFGWQSAFFLAIAAALVLAGALQVLRHDWDADRDPTASLRANPFADFMYMWRNSGLRLFAFAAFFYGAMQLSLTTFAVALLVGDLKFGLVEAGVVLAVLQTGGVVGRVSWGWLADRLRDGNAVLLMIAAASATAALATSQLGPETPKPMVYILFAVFSFAAVGWNGVAMAEIARLAPPGRAGPATGGVLVLTFAGILIGAPAFTAAHGWMGSYTATFGLFTAVALTGLFLVLAARRQG